MNAVSIQKTVSSFFFFSFHFILRFSFTNLFHIRFGWYYQTWLKRVHHLERQYTKANQLDIDWVLWSKRFELDWIGNIRWLLCSYVGNWIPIVISYKFYPLDNHKKNALTIVQAMKSQNIEFAMALYLWIR